MKKLIVFLIRKRLGLKKYERFTFVNQKSNTYYFFADDSLIKVWKISGKAEQSGVSLNWLLDDDCEIKKEDSTCW